MGQIRRGKTQSKLVPAKMREGGFIRLRTGIFDHVASGKMTPYDFAVYLTLHRWARWHTGICITTAASLASNWGAWGSTVASETDTEEQTANRKKRTIQNCLKRLRERGYIKYREGDGKRGSYAILIDKYEPSIGALVGWTLDASATEDFENPVYRYVSPTPFSDAYGEANASQHMAACAEHVRSTVRPVSASQYGQSALGGTPDCAVRVPFQDVLDMTKRILEDSKMGQGFSSFSTSGDSLREGTASFNIEEDDEDELA